MACRFAPVAPIQVLEQLFDRNPHYFGDYHLLLAHHTVEHPKRFEALFTRAKAHFGDSLTVIMDNSVVECGGAVDDKMMGDALDVLNDAGIRPIAVLPDVMGDGAATRKSTIASLEHWDHFNADFLAVCQGATPEDYQQSLNLFATYPADISWLSVPRIITAQHGSRWLATQQAIEVCKYTGQKLHLLGFSDNMLDDNRCARLEGVGGIDSAVPLRYTGLFNWSVALGPRPKDWFDTAQVTPIMLSNLHAVRESLAIPNFTQHVRTHSLETKDQ